MGGELVPVSSGGAAVIPATAGELATVSQGGARTLAVPAASARTAAPAAPMRTAQFLDSRPTEQLGKLARDLLSDLVIDGAFSCEDLDRILPELWTFAPQFEHALNGNDDRLLGQLAETVRDHLIRKGESRERIEWARQVLLRHAAPPEQVSARRAELIKLMGDPSSEYWKGPHAERLQQEFRDIVDNQQQWRRP